MVVQGFLKLFQNNRVLFSLGIQQHVDQVEHQQLNYELDVLHRKHHLYLYEENNENLLRECIFDELTNIAKF